MSHWAIELLQWLGPHGILWLKSFFTGNRKILVLGAGGVGKTSIGELLSHSMSMLKVETKYVESTGTDHFKVKGEGVDAQVFVVAGQPHRREATWTELLDSVKNGEIDGVILLNAYGYHAIGALGIQGQKEYRILKEHGEDQSRFLEAHLKAKREEELRVLEYIAPHLRARSKPLWMLSAITKEDLWYDDHDVVRSYYESGRYGELIEAIKTSLGDKNFRHELVTMSLVIKSFVTGRDEVLAHSSRRYDQEKQRDSARQFFQTLASLCK